MKKTIISLCIIPVLFTMCEKQSDKDETIEFPLLNSYDYILTADRVSNYPNVQLPNDDLQEDDYISMDESIKHGVTFLEDDKIVIIDPGSIIGTRTYDSEELKFYELDLFAGGRFVIWKNDEVFEAEYTIYGSGVPIIKSERGKLESVKK